MSEWSARRDRSRALVLALILAASSIAHADGDFETMVGRTPADPSATPTVVRVDGPWWQNGSAPRWLVEGTVAPGVWSSSTLLTPGGTQLDIGAAGAFGFRYVRPWRHHTAIHSDSNWIPALMFLTVGLIALPADTWLGNEQGLDVRVRGTGSPVAAWQPWTLSVGIAPIFRISTHESRARFPSIVGAILPEVGVSFGERQQALYFDWSLFPLGVMLVPHLGMELNIEQGVLVPFDGSPVRAFVGARIGMVVR